MSQLKCLCGQVYRDPVVLEGGKPSEGWLLRDQDAEQYYQDLSNDIAEFIDAILAGKRNEWLAKRFHNGYPTNLSNAQVIQDLRHAHSVDLSVIQCSNCGRLWVQEQPFANKWRSFRPDGEWKDTLAVRKK